jgi:hypothetical protein
MPVPNEHWWRRAWQRLPDALAEFPLLTAGEQTKLSWARRIEKAEETPPAFRSAVDALIAETGALPYLVLTPSYAAFLAPTTEKLVCCLPEEVRIYTRSGDDVRLAAYRYADVSAVEHGCILLKSWLKITGPTTGGTAVRTTIKFNTVTDYLFQPVLARLRGSTGAAGHTGYEAEQAKFNYLARDHYKFMNVAKRCILPGEEVVGAVMQGELRTPFVTLFGHVYTRLKAPAHILVRTDRELILAVEEDQEAWGGSYKYGSIRTYMPLAKVAAVQLEDAGTGAHLQIILQGGESIGADFSAVQAPAVRELVAALGRAPAG